MNTLQTTTLALLLLLASCASNKPVEKVEPQAVPIPEIEELEGDRDLEQHLELLILETKRRLGRKEVRLQVANNSELELRFRYALEWKNRRGDIIGGYHHDWYPMSLGGNESKIITIKGPTGAAETWRLHAEDLDSKSDESQAAPSN